MTKRIKKLSAKDTPHFTLKPPQDIDYDTHKPIFSFRHMQYQSRTCLSQCNRNDKSYIVNLLLQLSQFSWKDITSKPRQGLGFEGIPCNQFNVSFPPFVTEDVEKLKVFRYSHAGRIAGIRIDDVYHILIVGTNLYSH